MGIIIKCVRGCGNSVTSLFICNSHNYSYHLIYFYIQRDLAWLIDSKHENNLNMKVGTGNVLETSTIEYL